VDDWRERGRRIEALKEALREIADKRKMDAVAAVSMRAIARAALTQNDTGCGKSVIEPWTP